MEVGAACAAVVVVIGVVLLAARGRRSGEAKSVSGYRQTLDVLGSLGGTARGRGPVDPRTVAARGPRPARIQSASAGTVPVYGSRTEGPGGPGGPSRPPGLPGVPGDDDDSDVGDPARYGRARGTGPRAPRSLDVTDRRARRLGVPVAVGVLVLAAAGAGVYIEMHARRTPPKKTHTASTPTTAPTHTSHPVTVATAPHAYAPVATGSTRATYVPVATDYSVTIGATTGPCWVSVTSGGKTVLEQTFAAGASTSVSLSGAATVVLGAPEDAAVSIGGVPVELPSGAGAPFTMTFAPG